MQVSEDFSSRASKPLKFVVTDNQDNGTLFAKKWYRMKICSCVQILKNTKKIPKFQSEFAPKWISLSSG